MATFFKDLWESIFTPGPTPTLLKAANASFAALQLVLLVLLVATQSVHLVILSVLCGGLWWSINWFVAELQIHQEREERRERDEARRKRLAGASSAASSSADEGKGGDEDEDEDEDTETEVQKSARLSPAGPEVVPDDVKAAGDPVEPVERVGEVRRREAAVSGTQSSVSTEDEWEKVSESENDKQK